MFPSDVSLNSSDAFDGGNLAARVSALIDHFLQWKKNKTDKTFIPIGCALMTNIHSWYGAVHKLCRLGGRVGVGGTDPYKDLIRSIFVTLLKKLSSEIVFFSFFFKDNFFNYFSNMLPSKS